MSGVLQPQVIEMETALRELAAEVGVSFATLRGVWQEKAYANEYLQGEARGHAEAKAFGSVASTYRKRKR